MIQSDIYVLSNWLQGNKHDVCINGQPHSAQPGGKDLITSSFYSLLTLSSWAWICPCMLFNLAENKIYFTSLPVTFQHY